jgi:hypothetical protein
MRSDDLKPLVKSFYEGYKMISIRGFLLVAYTELSLLAAKLMLSIGSR